MATLEDYQTAVDVIDEMYIGTSTGATDKVRELIAAVQTFPHPPSQKDVAEHLGISEQAVSKRVRAAIRDRWLRNIEDRPGRAARLATDETLPTRSGLPTVQQIRDWVPPRPPRTPVTRPRRTPVWPPYSQNLG